MPSPRPAQRGEGRPRSSLLSPPLSSARHVEEREWTRTQGEMLPLLLRCLLFVEMNLAAAAGNAPALPVSETGVQTSTLSGKNGSPCW
jgi:hypothetical protein